MSLAVGLGVPIPVLDEEVMRHAALGDEDLVTQVVDYSHDYPELVARSLGEGSYAQLRSGSITVQGREVADGLALEPREGAENRARRSGTGSPPGTSCSASRRRRCPGRAPASRSRRCTSARSDLRRWV